MRRSAPQQPTRITNGQQHSEDSRRYWEEKRLMFLLGSTSILFSVCITPQLVLSLMIHEAVLQSYYFQVMECFFFSSTPSFGFCVQIIFETNVLAKHLIIWHDYILSAGQVFRAVANILEVTNYSFTFYIYCLFSRDFRATLLQTLRISSRSSGPTQTCL